MDLEAILALEPMPEEEQPVEFVSLLLEDEKDGLTLIHLGQVHKIPGKVPDEFRKAVVNSQIKIVEYLRKEKIVAVIAEGLFEDANPALFKALDDPAKVNMLGVAKLIFPKGIPADLSKLSDLQKEFLYENGAAMSMWFTGELKEVYRSIRPEASKAIDAKIAAAGEKKYGKAWPVMIGKDKELSDLIFKQRDEAALEEVARVQKTGALKIALIFGQAHDFSGIAKARFKGVRFEKIAMSAAILEPAGGRPAKSDFGVDLTFKPFIDFKGNFSAALVVYGNQPKDDVMLRAKIVVEQRKILTFLKENKRRLAAWEWQHFVTPELKIAGLEFLDPKSLDAGFPLADFRIDIAADPALKKAGEAWIAAHKLKE